MGWLQRIIGSDASGGRSGGLAPSGERNQGNPPSANGASSMHLFWDLDGRFAAAEVTLTVIEPPRVDRLYFWALQATFTDGTEDLGGAHLDPKTTFTNVKSFIKEQWNAIKTVPIDLLLENRYQKFRKMGKFDSHEALTPSGAPQ